jgi:hypothetical protein
MQWFLTASTAAGKRTGLCRKSRPPSGRRTWTGRTGSITGIASSTATPSTPATCAASSRSRTSSAGKKKGKGSTGHGNAYLAAILGNAAGGAARTDTFLGDKYRRIARRRGSKRAIVALGRSILVIAWHLLSDPDARFYDLGPGSYAARIDPERRKRSHIRQLEALGYTVTLEPAA